MNMKEILEEGLENAGLPGRKEIIGKAFEFKFTSEDAREGIVVGIITGIIACSNSIYKFSLSTSLNRPSGIVEIYYCSPNEKNPKGVWKAIINNKTDLDGEFVLSDGEFTLLDY